MELSFAVPEPTIVDTRAFGSQTFESDIVNATVFILKEASEQSDRVVLQTASLNGTNSTKISYNDDVKKELKDGSTIRIIAVANSDISLNGVGNEADIYALSTTKQVTDEAMPGMIMTGVLTGQTKNALNHPVTVELVRAAAKATVKVKEGVPFKISEYQIYNSASTGYFAAGIGGAKEDIASSVSSFTPRSNKAEGAANPVYGYGQNALTEPAKNLGTDGRAFLVVGGTFDNATTYYRIDFRSKDENGDYTYYFLQPNHEYQFTITKVKSKGYSTPEEAAKHPLQDIEVEIHDHVPAIMSMTSDGARELGVNREVRHTNTDSDGGEYMTMKLFSYINANEYPSITLDSDYDTKELTIGSDFKIEVTSGDWLKIGKITSASDENEAGEAASTTNGKLYHVGLKYDSSVKLTGELEGSLRVTWKGLTRDVKVIWKRTFKPTDICDATLQIIYSGSKTSKVDSKMSSPIDYWDFIGASESNNVTDVKGLSQADNCDNIRNEGFHLPLYYGGEEDAKNWTYKYVITLKDAVYTSGANVTATTSDYRDLSIKVNGPTITIECPAHRYGWDYNGEGKLLIKVGTAEYPFSLYHTGFFHKEGQYDLHGDTDGATKHNAPSSDYYYYEVRTIGEYHWLDRNIGATSNAMAVRDGNTGSIVVGNANAAGGYFRAAKYKMYADPGDKDQLFDLCPPGFRIPFTSEWDALRNSDNYHDSQAIDNGEVYYQSYVVDDKNMPVYLPKVQYYTNSFVGDSRAGYYWTRTQASGVEKEEIGKWMRALMFSGASNSYINGNAQDYGMQVRGVAGELKDNGPAMNTFGFKVKGATHVFIYDAGEIYPVGLSATDKREPEDGGHHDAQKYGLMSWPGQAIGDASTMVNGSGNDGLTYNFTYTTSTPKSDLRFVFAYVKDGKITVFCRKIESDKEGVNRYNGYPLTDHYYFNNVDNKVIEVGDKQSVVDNTKKYRVYIWEKSDNSKPRGARIYAGNTLVVDADWAGFRKEGEYYYCDFQSSDESFKVKWSLKYDCSGGNGHNGHTADYSTQQETSNGSMGYNSSIDRYCMTIKNWNESTMSAPGGSGDDPNPPTTTVVKIIGNFNGWSMDGVNPDESGNTKFESVELNGAGSDSNQIGKFRMQIIENGVTKNYSYQNAVSAGSSVTLGESSNSMWISGATASDLYDIEFNVNTKQFKATKVNGGSQTTEDTKTYQIQWYKDTNDFYQVRIQYTDGTYPSAFSSGYQTNDGAYDTLWHYDFKGLIPNKPFNVYITKPNGAVYVMRHKTLTNSDFSSGEGGKYYYKIGKTGDFEPVLDAGKRRIFFKNEDNWSDPQIWGWTTGNGSAHKMTKLATNQTWYFYDGAPSEFTNIIFRNGEWTNKYPSDGNWTVGNDTDYYFNKNGSTTERPWD